MNVKVKKSISLFLVVILSLLTRGEALAASNESYLLSSSLSDSIEPRWDNTTSVENFPIQLMDMQQCQTCL